MSLPDPAGCDEGGAAENPDLGDGDADGVVDRLDRCPDTHAGDLAGTDGCPICNCGGIGAGRPWPSRRAYLQCVKAEVKRRQAAGLLTRQEGLAIVKGARKSTCGRADLTRCCIYPRGGRERDARTVPNVRELTPGRCRLTRPRQCAKTIARHGDAHDAGAGSCQPNPCVP
jgi:hypothetical protein